MRACCIVWHGDIAVALLSHTLTSLSSLLGGATNSWWSNQSQCCFSSAFVCKQCKTISKQEKHLTIRNNEVSFNVTPEKSTAEEINRRRLVFVILIIIIDS